MKNKKIHSLNVFLFILIIFSIKINAQSTIEKLFYEIPFESAYNFNKEAKSSLLKNGLMCKFFDTDSIYSLTIPGESSYSRHFLSCYAVKKYLPKNGYLEFERNDLKSDNGGRYTMSYWNISDGSKLIAVKYIEFATVSFDKVFFYKYINNTIVKIENSDILPELKLMDLVNLEKIKTDGLSIEKLQKIYKKMYLPSYKLPIEGKDLKYELELWDGFLSTKEEHETYEVFKKYFNEEIFLEWNDGSFKLKT